MTVCAYQIDVITLCENLHHLYSELDRRDGAFQRVALFSLSADTTRGEKSSAGHNDLFMSTQSVESRSRRTLIRSLCREIGRASCRDRV